MTQKHTNKQTNNETRATVNHISRRREKYNSTMTSFIRFMTSGNDWWMCRLLCSRCSIMVHWVQVISVPISLGSRTRRTTCTNLQLLNILYVSRSYASPSCSHSVRPCNDNKQTSVWQQARYERVYRRYISGYIPRDDKEIFPGGPPPAVCSNFFKRKFENWH